MKLQKPRTYFHSGYSRKPNLRESLGTASLTGPVQLTVEEGQEFPRREAVSKTRMIQTAILMAEKPQVSEIFHLIFFLSIPRVNTQQFQTNQIQSWFLPKGQKNRSRGSHQPLF